MTSGMGNRRATRKGRPAGQEAGATSGSGGRGNRRARRQGTPPGQEAGVTGPGAKGAWATVPGGHLHRGDHFSAGPLHQEAGATAGTGGRHDHQTRRQGRLLGQEAGMTTGPEGRGDHCTYSGDVSTRCSLRHILPFFGGGCSSAS